MNRSLGARYRVAVAAGKGGVGKSSVCMNLAITLSELGYAVGVLDADLYGPSLGRMMPLDKPISKHSEEADCFYPGESSRVKIFSMGHFKGEGDPLIVRAPIANGLLLQCKKNIVWGELDYLLVDFPPGTGDLQLTLIQEMAFSGAVLVTMPQEVSRSEVLKTAEMFLQVRVPILGIIENMAYFEDRETKKVHVLFGEGGGKQLAATLGSPLLGKIPLEPLFCLSCDQGENFQKKWPQSTFTKQFYDVVPKLQEILWNQSQEEAGQVYLLEKHALSCFFNSEEEVVLDLADLQNNCPCRVCMDLEKKEERENVEASKISFVGNYAIQVDFTSGCSKGIYTFSLLKKLALKQKAPS